MTPSRSDLDNYDAQPLLDFANQVRTSATQIEGMFERYVTTVTASDWQGVAAEAAHSRAVADRKTANALVDTLEGAAGRLEQGYWDISTPLRNARHLIASAETAGFLVPATGLGFLNAPMPVYVSHPAGRDPTPEREAVRANWEDQIVAAADAVEAADTRLQQDLSALGTAMKAQFDAVGHSQTTHSEGHFNRAERFILDEMRRNLNSDSVKQIQELLRSPQSFLEWLEYSDPRHGGRSTAVDRIQALAAWRDLVGSEKRWDHKPQIARDFGLVGDPRQDPAFFFQQPGTHRQVNYDMYSNIHFGFVGRHAGFDGDTLLEGARMASQHDQGDEITMRAGIAMYDKYGPNITDEQFHQGMVAAIDEMEAAQSEGQHVPQIKHDSGR
ncbi:polymorphic toxin type 44 domain-containing protein [Nocardia iowensis]|uniref:Bacterial toxin 44 domain-containing protein n=1 Tax=Nocardia iowensis TaxID=204891 RepID=A0ABX8RXY2_NOCIO|nr:polymorphic toxin type 44 domain-containing protein [Nocardia iowensis]QXN94524.1 hypothetical protein KV110_16595 [Nocardia iowensis]